MQPHTTWRRARSWQRAPFLRLLPATVAGILLYDYRAADWPGAMIVGCVAVVTILFLGTALPHGEAAWLRRARTALLQAMVAALSLLNCALGDERRATHWYGHSLAAGSAYQLRLSGEPQLRERSWKLPVNMLAALDSGGRPHSASGQATLYLYRNGDTLPPFGEGDIIVVANHWQPVRNDGNPQGFDLERFSRRNNLFHAQVCGREEVLLLRSADPAAQSWLRRGHHWCVRQLCRYLPERATFGLLQAMLMGDERDFDEDLRQAYSDTGVVHIVSISGSHTATLFLIVTLLLFWIRSKRWVWIRFALGLLLVWVYVLMAGAPPSALRSAVMFSVFSFGAIIGRQGNPLNTLLAAAFVLLAAQPGWLFSVGFQLSFLAVLSLVLFYKPLYRLLPQRSWIGRQVWALLAGSLAAELLTAPLVVFYFHSFPLLFLVANLLAVLLVGLMAMGGGLAILAFCWLPPLARATGWCVTKTVRIFNTAILWLQEQTPPALQHLRLSLPELLLLYASIAGFAFFAIRKEKRAGLAGELAACCLMVLLLRDALATRAQSRLIVYNANRRFLAELQLGNQFFIAGKDSGKAPVRPAEAARNASGAWRGGKFLNSPCFTFHGQQVLVLAQPAGTSDSTPFPVDILVAGYPLRPDQLSRLQACFRPKQLVVAGYQKLWVKKALEDSVAAGNRQLYLTWVKGAFVLE